MTTRLYLIRHAEAEGNSLRRFQGWTDGHLTENGLEQIRLLGERFRNIRIDALYASDLQRARQTAEAVGRYHGLMPVTRESLREIYGGNWEDVPWDQLPDMFPESYDAWENRPWALKMPAGESMEQLQERIYTAVEAIARENTGKHVALVTHGTAIRTLLCKLRGLPHERLNEVHWHENTAVTVLAYCQGEWEVLSEGDRSHLTQETGTLTRQEWWIEDMKNRQEQSMNQTSNAVISWLFETNAVRVAPWNKPFWYTSGTIGPFYVNTHFLYGNEAKANQLLADIDMLKADKVTCPEKVSALVETNYQEDRIFRGLMDAMTAYVKAHIDVDSIGYVSGGERRDWFFSLLIAKALNKPHITIYKDLSAVITADGQTTEAKDLQGANVLHVADLITEASSYERAWIPAVSALNGKMLWSLVVVDRKQGGGELLQKHGVASFSMVDIDKNMFELAKMMEYISSEQLNLVMEYLEQPKESMARFMKTNPEFMEQALSGDSKTRERAMLCLEKDFYGLN